MEKWKLNILMKRCYVKKNCTFFLCNEFVSRSFTPQQNKFIVYSLIFAKKTSNIWNIDGIFEDILLYIRRSQNWLIAKSNLEKEKKYDRSGRIFFHRLQDQNNGLTNSCACLVICREKKPIPNRFNWNFPIVINHFAVFRPV